jgi:hypothetical protein
MINQFNEKDDNTHKYVEELDQILSKCVDFNNTLHENGIINPFLFAELYAAFLRLSEKFREVI